MIVLAFALAFVLYLIAAIHAYWGLGGVWPGTDQASCARAVVGARGIRTMPTPFACFAVTACLIVVTLWPLALVGVFATPFPKPGLAASALMVALVFIGRGIAGFTPAWRRLSPEMPFARLDRQYYSPLCLVIGTGFVILAFNGFQS
ncbi:hypothetical protein Amn_03690 [Aminobacter sp. Y103A]|uniref:DUF3995 domain-containing protein n=1 Tax=unclassified Aminobacter TaxID=2644704 RepID=UPI0012B132DE|nr:MULTISPECIES: DUF3995 domain-containing protein [unclassified Aminobacter]MRX34542.1 DUF3995 domain-containing protein [Aminobacter sp. MDW-2]QNH34855.1 DUF3995 domain-containing protein [Aminobacter sp. MDW-2]BBD35489.1 hypothetical protein Amn_03690 [Aminobacter sp. SS-2016]